jgi:hypothetical protein
MRKNMKRLLLTLLLLLCAVGVGEAGRVTSPEIAVGTLCTDFADNDGDNLVDAADPDCAVGNHFVAIGANYRVNIENGLKIGGFVNTVDASFPTGDRVDKPTGTDYAQGEIALRGSFTSGTYEVWWIGSVGSEVPNRAVWVATSPHGDTPDNREATLVGGSTPTWQQLFKAETFANFGAGTLSATPITFTLNGNGAIFIKSVADVRHGCLFLRLVGDTTLPSCEGETPSGPTEDYAVLKLSGAAPTSCADTQFNNANIVQWTGFSSVTDAVPTVKILHDATKFYMCAVFPDNNLVAPNTVNDTSMSGNDRVQIIYRNSTATTDKDSNTFQIEINANSSGGVRDVNYPNNVADTADSRSVSRTVTLTGDLDGVADDTQWQLFTSWTAGFTLTDGMKIVADLGHLDNDASFTFRHAHNTNGSGFTIPTNWGEWLISATLVPGGGGDVIAPTVSSFAVPAGTIETNSAIGTASTDEAGTCRIHYGTSTGNYTNQTAGSSSNNGVCSEAISDLAGDTQYFAEMRVTDAAGNVGDSTEVSFTTDTVVLPTACNRFAAPTVQGNGNGLTQANASLVSTMLTNLTVGQTGCLLDGTYTGSTGMIKPPSGKNGTSLARLTVKALNDGEVLIDGQDVANRNCIHLFDNDWWVFEGFNLKRCDQNIGVHGGSSNNTFRRIVEWDPTITGIIFSGGSSDNVVEDSAGFGSGRKRYSTLSSSNRNVLRRHWASYGGSALLSGPHMTYSLHYTTKDGVFENVIGSWTGTGAQPFGIMSSADGMRNCTSANFMDCKRTGTRIRGGIFYIRDGASFQPNEPLLAANQHDYNFRDVMIFLGSGLSAKRTVNLGECKWTGGEGGPSPSQDCTESLREQNVLQHSSLVGSTNKIIHSDWTATNNVQEGSLAAIYGGDGKGSSGSSLWVNNGTSQGATFCKRWQNGTLTSTGVFNSAGKWPMNARINAAILASGRTIASFFGGSTDLTDYLEDTFGAIPAGCK